MLCLDVAATGTLCTPRPQEIIRVQPCLMGQVVVEVERVAGDVPVLLRICLVLGNVPSQASSADVAVVEVPVADELVGRQLHNGVAVVRHA